MIGADFPRRSEDLGVWRRAGGIHEDPLVSFLGLVGHRGRPTDDQAVFLSQYGRYIHADKPVLMGFARQLIMLQSAAALAGDSAAGYNRLIDGQAQLVKEALNLCVTLAEAGPRRFDPPGYPYHPAQRLSAQFLASSLLASCRSQSMHHDWARQMVPQMLQGIMKQIRQPKGPGGK